LDSRNSQKLNLTDITFVYKKYKIIKEQ